MRRHRGSTVGCNNATRAVIGKALALACTLVLFSACQPPEDRFEMSEKNGDLVVRYGTGIPDEGEIRFALNNNTVGWKAQRISKGGSPAKGPACLGTGVCYRSSDNQLMRREPGADEWTYVLEFSEVASGAPKSEHSIAKAPTDARLDYPGVGIAKGDTAVWVASSDSDRTAIVARQPDGRWVQIVTFDELPDKRFRWEYIYLVLVPMALLSLWSVFALRRTTGGRVLGVMSALALIPAGCWFLLGGGLRASSSALVDLRRTGWFVLFSALPWFALWLSAHLVDRKKRTGQPTYQ